MGARFANPSHRVNGHKKKERSSVAQRRYERRQDKKILEENWNRNNLVLSLEQIDAESYLKGLAPRYDTNCLFEEPKVVVPTFIVPDVVGTHAIERIVRAASLGNFVSVSKLEVGVVPTKDAESLIYKDEVMSEQQSSSSRLFRMAQWAIVILTIGSLLKGGAIDGLIGFFGWSPDVFRSNEPGPISSLAALVGVNWQVLAVVLGASLFALSWLPGAKNVCAHVFSFFISPFALVAKAGYEVCAWVIGGATSFGLALLAAVMPKGPLTDIVRSSNDATSPLYPKSLNLLNASQSNEQHSAGQWAKQIAFNALAGVAVIGFSAHYFTDAFGLQARHAASVAASAATNTEAPVDSLVPTALEAEGSPSDVTMTETLVTRGKLVGSGL